MRTPLYWLSETEWKKVAPCCLAVGAARIEWMIDVSSAGCVPALVGDEPMRRGTSGIWCVESRNNTRFLTISRSLRRMQNFCD